MKYRSGDMDFDDPSHGTVNDEPSMAVQSEKDNCDINVIMKRFGVTGVVPQVQMPPSIKEFGEVFDYQSALNTCRKAEMSFMALNADVRAKFNNDPHLFVEFCMDEKNIPEMRKMGLSVPEVVPPQEVIQKVQVVNPA